jgi:hypothetical protein
MCSHSQAIKETISKSALPPPDENNNTASSTYKREKGKKFPALSNSTHYTTSI